MHIGMSIDMMSILALISEAGNISKKLSVLKSKGFDFIFLTSAKGQINTGVP
jgi:hypothetical protein